MVFVETYEKEKKRDEKLKQQQCRQTDLKQSLKKFHNQDLFLNKFCIKIYTHTHIYIEK